MPSGQSSKKSDGSDGDQSEDVPSGPPTKKFRATGKSNSTLAAKAMGKSIVPFNKLTKRAKATERAAATKQFNDMCKKGVITPTRMYYDSKENKYYVYNLAEMDGEHAQAIRKTLVEDLDVYNAYLVQRATRTPNEWVGPSLGDAGGAAEAPGDISTKVRCLYQQHNNPYCLSYSLASTLFYCGFKEQAQVMAEGAKDLSGLDYDRQLSVLQGLMRDLVPLIGDATLYGIRTNRHDRKKRSLTWNELFTDLTPYPTLVIPKLLNGSCTHAFCVVDDLIFDSITPYALKLQEESLQWIFNDRETTIYQAFRFNKKYSPPRPKKTESTLEPDMLPEHMVEHEECSPIPKRNKTKGKYKRKIQYNWENNYVRMCE
jgi:hypothetical protein